MAERPPYPKVAAAATGGRRTRVMIGSVPVGAGQFAVIAGPPTAWTRDQAVAQAEWLAAAGADVLHDGTSSQLGPSAQPLAHRIEIASAMREATGLPIAMGLTDPAELAEIAAVADVVQIAGVHMQNYTLLSELGRIDIPVVLRRGSTSLLDELLMAAEYILHGGNPSVLLCERGIRTFERAHEATVDFAAIPILQERSHLPVLVDPSENPSPRLIGPLAVAAAAAGADAVILELHGRQDELLRRVRTAAQITRPSANA
jgi:3-deoxy-7-phosphoheptulonate synthase